MTNYEAIAGTYHEAQKGLTNRFAGEKISAATTLEASGETTLHSPVPGNQLTLFWIFLSSSQENTGEVLATVKIGTETAYETYLGNPGLFAHWEPILGAVNAKLILNLSGNQKVAVSYTYSEQAP